MKSIDSTGDSASSVNINNSSSIVNLQHTFTDTSTNHQLGPHDSTSCNDEYINISRSKSPVESTVPSNSTFEITQAAKEVQNSVSRMSNGAANDSPEILQPHFESGKIKEKMNQAINDVVMPEPVARLRSCTPTESSRFFNSYSSQDSCDRILTKENTTIESEESRGNEVIELKSNPECVELIQPVVVEETTSPVRNEECRTFIEPQIDDKLSIPIVHPVANEEIQQIIEPAIDGRASASNIYGIDLRILRGDSPIQEFFKKPNENHKPIENNRQKVFRNQIDVKTETLSQNYARLDTKQIEDNENTKISDETSYLKSISSDATLFDTDRVDSLMYNALQYNASRGSPLLNASRGSPLLNGTCEVCPALNGNKGDLIEPPNVFATAPLVLEEEEFKSIYSGGHLSDLDSSFAMPDQSLTVSEQLIFVPGQSSSVAWWTRAQKTAVSKDANEAELDHTWIELNTPEMPGSLCVSERHVWFTSVLHKVYRSSLKETSLDWCSLKEKVCYQALFYVI